jgi:sugar (pentulose or hexulose) kinase
MADAPLLMGIDVGTTAVKVVVYDIGGAERHRFARATRPRGTAVSWNRTPPTG